MNRILEGLSYDEETQTWTASFPWIRDPNELPNNYRVALARLHATEKRLKKSGNGAAYDEQIQDMVRRGVARRLSDAEIRDYKGPVHYIQQHEVANPKSKSTPLRLVGNTSASSMGHVLNDYWEKGADVMNNMISVLFYFRIGRHAILGDVHKMFK